MTATAHTQQDSLCFTPLAATDIQTAWTAKVTDDNAFIIEAHCYAHDVPREAVAESTMHYAHIHLRGFGRKLAGLPVVWLDSIMVTSHGPRDLLTLAHASLISRGEEVALQLFTSPSGPVKCWVLVIDRLSVKP